MTGTKTNERPGTRAQVRHARFSASKARAVLDIIRNLPADEALDVLRYTERGASETISRCLASAVANAQHNDELDAETLYVSACYADEGPTLKRWRPRARGRATRIRKRTCHITIIVSPMPADMAAKGAKVLGEPRIGSIGHRLPYVQLIVAELAVRDGLLAPSALGAVLGFQHAAAGNDNVVALLVQLDNFEFQFFTFEVSRFANRANVYQRTGKEGADAGHVNGETTFDLTIDNTFDNFISTVRSFEDFPGFSALGFFAGQTGFTETVFYTFQSNLNFVTDLQVKLA